MPKNMALTGTRKVTREVFVEPARFVEAGARIVRGIREGCTPGDILDVLADIGEIDPGEYRRLVLGILADPDGSGDIKP